MPYGKASGADSPRTGPAPLAPVPTAPLRGSGLGSPPPVLTQILQGRGGAAASSNHCAALASRGAASVWQRSGGRRSSAEPALTERGGSCPPVQHRLPCATVQLGPHRHPQPRFVTSRERRATLRGAPTECSTAGVRCQGAGWVAQGPPGCAVCQPVLSSLYLAPSAERALLAPPLGAA